MGRAALEVADIFRIHGPAWREAQHGHLSLAQLKVMSAIEQCRSAALGGHVLHCDRCGTEQISYNSCRNRHCPKCQASAAQRWLEARTADLLPVEYYHMVFTLPAPIADIAYQNKAVLYGLLFDVVADTLLTIAADPKHLGARIGATLVLHTWGSALTHHPHVHGIVPGGGLAPDGTNWIACRRGFFLSVRVLSRLFRWRFLEELQRAHQAGKLRFYGEHVALADAQAFKAWLAPLRNCEWVVYAKRPFAGPQAVLAYLSRYTHRVAISNSRLIALDERGVTFRWKNYRAKGRTRYKAMTLDAGEFMRRFLLHVLPAGFHRIRHDGLLANCSRTASLALARQLLQVPTQESQQCEGAFDAARPTFVCPHCGHAMIVVQIFTRGEPIAHHLGHQCHERSSLPAPCMFVGRSPVGAAISCLATSACWSLASGRLAVHDALHRRRRPPRHRALARHSHARLHRQAATPIAIAPRHQLPRAPRFPPSRLVRHLPSAAATRVVGDSPGQVSNNP